jgi:hypothetical protein
VKPGVSIRPAVSGGVHSGLDAVKVGDGRRERRGGGLRRLRIETELWMQANEYTSLAQMLGNIKPREVPRPVGVLAARRAQAARQLCRMRM